MILNTAIIKAFDEKSSLMQIEVCELFSRSIKRNVMLQKLSVTYISLCIYVCVSKFFSMQNQLSKEYKRS